MRLAGALWLEMLVTAAGPFAQMESPVQAMVQAIMKKTVQSVKHDKFICFSLDMLKAVPLMHADYYELLLQTAADAGISPAGSGAHDCRLPCVSIA